MQASTPKGLRLHIGFFGRRNVGKSSLLNALTRQQVSIVSAVAGTTTDPVEKAMELLPLGPVLLIDTAGVDDEGALGRLRIEKTRQAIDRTEVAVLVAEAGVWGDFEAGLLKEFRARELPVIVAFNKADVSAPPSSLVKTLKESPARVVLTSAVDRTGLDELRQALLEAAPAGFLDTPALVGDLVGPGELAILVVPIDKEAPKGRLILPQVQAIRDLLESNSLCLVVKETELPAAFARLKTAPRLVVTDSQAFAEVAKITPVTVPLTGFSILMSRFKGDLVSQVEGTLAIDDLEPGEKVLVAESCTHHPIGEDIGRVKIPRWLNQRVGGPLEFVTVQGHDFPEDLSPYRLVIHCGACMWNRREMLSRIWRCRQAGVPITNYGLSIAHSLGMLGRALGPFPEALQVFQQHRPGRTKTLEYKPLAVLP